MFKTILNQYSLNQILSIFVLLIIPTYPLGPFIPDFFLSISALIFLVISFKHNLKKYFKNIYSYFFLAFFIYITINSFFAINPKVSLLSSGFYFRFYLFSLAIWYLLSTEKYFLKYLFYVLTATLVFVIFDTLIQYFFGYDIFGYSTLQHRLTGPFGDELIVGSFISKIAPVVFSLYFLIFEKISKKFFFLFILCIVVTFFSGERTAFFLILLFGIFFFFFIEMEKKSKFISLGILILSLILISNVIIDKSRLNRMIIFPICAMNIDIFSLFECEEKKRETGLYEDIDRPIIFSSAHEGHFLSAYKMFLDDPIFGKGNKMFRYHCSDDKFKNVHSCTTHPHNLLLQILAELGIVGFIFLLVVLIKIYKNLFILIFSKKIKLPKNKKISFLLINVSLIQIFFIFLPTGQFFNNYLSILYYLPLGIFLKLDYKYFNVR